MIINKNKKSIILMCLDVDRAIQVNGKAFSQILDPLGDYFQEKGFKVVRVQDFESKLKKASIYKANFSLKNEIKKLTFYLRIKNFFSKKKFYPRKFLRLITYRRMILKNKPVIICAIDPEKVLCRIARKLNCIIVNIAHGFGATDSHYNYGSSFRKKIHEEDEPEAFICFDKSTYNTHRKGDDGKSTLTYLAKRPKIYLQENRFKLKKENCRTILVILQWGYTGEFKYLDNIIQDGIMPNPLKEIIQNESNFFWLIKYHPVQIRNPVLFAKTKYYIKNNFQNKLDNIIDVSFLPLSYCLKSTDLVITMMSTAVYEAAAEGIPSLTMCPSVLPGGTHADYFLDLESEGILKKSILNKKEILKVLKSEFIKNRHPPKKNNWPEVHDVIMNEILKIQK